MKKATSERFLLDVNVLVALTWPHHPFHRAAVHRMHSVEAWASCALTQLGFLRISMNPALVSMEIGASRALALLTDLVRDTRHEYLGTELSPAAAPKSFEHAHGYRQVTDVYLVALAAHHGAKFLTLDAKLRSLAGVEVLI